MSWHNLPAEIPIYYEDDSVVLINADCRDILPLLPKVNLVLTDPPYGMNNNPDSSRFSGGTQQSVDRRGGKGGKFKVPIIGDDTPFDPSPFIDFDNVIMWGYNHYASRLPVGTTLVWIKRLDGAFGSFLSDAELAWMKGGCGVYCQRDTSFLGTSRKRAHPNEKPVALMKWCIGLVKDANLILDPFAGVCTTGVAAKQLGRRCILIEMEERYAEIGAKRLSQEELVDILE